MECRSIVMLHELSHVKRRDCLMQGLAQLACAIYWFNPLVWIAAWRLRVERELACDDHVLEAGAKASDYASQLVEIASSFGVANCGSPVAVGMACSHLESRVRSILDPNARRRGVNGLRVALAAVIAAVLTAPLATLQPWRGAEASERIDSASVNSSGLSKFAFPASLLQSLKNQDQAERDKIAESDFINGMKRAGYNNLTAEKLVELKAVGVTPEFVESMRRAGFDRLTADDLTELKAMGVNEAFVKEAQGWGFGKLSKDDLVQIKAMGISPEYARSMKALGFDNLSLEKLVEVKAVGVNAEFIKQMRELGFDKLTIDQLVEMKAVGVTPDYVRKMRAIGLKNLSVNELIEMKATGVDKILIREKR